MLGIVLGLMSGVLFGAFSVCIKVGMRHRDSDDGLFMGVLITCVLSGLALFAVELPPWDWLGLAFFLVAGMMTTFAARSMALVAIRRIGPAHQAAILSSAPLFAAISGWIVLAEVVRPLQALGGAITLAGLLLLVGPRLQHENSGPGEMTPDVRKVAGVTKHPAVVTTSYFRGYLYGLAAAALFGAGYIVRKSGLTHFDSPIAGAFIGALVSLVLIVIQARIRGRLRLLVRDNLRNIPWWFVVAGIASGVGLVAQFLALNYLAAWIVSLLQGTQAAWTLLFSYVFLSNDEVVTRHLLVSTALIVFGIVVVTIGV